VNLQLDKTLMEYDISHITVFGPDTTVWEEYTTHGSHLNSVGKMRLTYVTAESKRDGHVPSRNSGIPVITHARASPF